ncbi:alpha-L-arabinofuranosidase C-terminal domain-containing protein [Saccharicrinis sp. FJH54]|uniref:alpha-L-arabinofuranosidase C-terminal domain-containing protein n=1 Tax=Saccharicrinis sp. FJH54 TaxID=3344665 RepID=UPI0035D458D5
MKIKSYLLVIVLAISSFVYANEPDSAYVFSYTNADADGRSGLHFAWSIDQENWHAIGPDFSFVKSDFGSWGSQKRMFDPYVFLDPDGKWHAVWTLNHRVTQFAHAASDDLSFWWRQSYPYVMESGNCLLPEVSYDKANERFVVTWMSDRGDEQGIYMVTTPDFVNYSDTQKASEKDRINNRREFKVNEKPETGTVYKVAWSTIDGLTTDMEAQKYRDELNNERAEDDPERFRYLKAVDAEIKVKADDNKQISDMLIGIFFEDINYAADGGLYAEFVQNRDFEYNSGIRREWNHKSYWSLENEADVEFSIDTVNPIHAHNKYYAVLDVKKTGAGLVNPGYDGMGITAGEKYDFSVFAKSLDGSKNSLLIQLLNQNDEVIGEAKTKALSAKWKKLSTVIKAKENCVKAKIVVKPAKVGKVGLDMISLFPENTFKGRQNGLRQDLAQTIADMHPRFVRFPGGCVAHGNGIDNIYNWKNTIGPLESRIQQRNTWGYNQSGGLGYFEYFQFCEDLGAEPVPVLAAGVPCQNSSIGGDGQQGGIPMCDMDDYVQDVLDLIEWANGDKNSEWGRKRAEAGHPEPFNLRYIGIGNEDLITDIFEERFTMIYKAVKEKYPEMKVIGTAGPFYYGTDYEEGWKIGKKLGVDLLDEHYYVPPGWFIYNQDYYDKYDRSGPKVYLGEYASHLPRRPLNIETALSEALYLTAIERNGDVVHMTSYAPLLAREHRTQWNPDLIYFNSSEVKPTTDYYVQKMYGQHSGTTYFASDVKLSDQNVKVQNRVGVSVVKDEKNNELIVKLVNMLPVEVNSSLDLSDFDLEAANAKLSVLEGDPKDRDAKPADSSIEVDKRFSYKMDPYSFSVIRISLK